jgi:DNA-directed RNA polymerase specialized sigma24 family protein
MSLHHLEWPTVVERCLQGDQDAWFELERRLRPQLRPVLRRLAGRRADIDELIQGILIRLWTNGMKCLHCLDSHRSPIPFLTTVGKRLYLDAVRSEGRRLERCCHGKERRFVVMYAALPIDRVTDYRLIPQAVEAIIADFVGSLTEKNRDVFRRRVLNPPGEEGAGAFKRTEQRMVERLARRLQERECVGVRDGRI